MKVWKRASQHCSEPPCGRHLTMVPYSVLEQGRNRPNPDQGIETTHLWYYAVPYTYVGRAPDARAAERVVQLFHE
jgi:hypothetical protein